MCVYIYVLYVCVHVFVVVFTETYTIEFVADSVALNFNDAVSVCVLMYIALI